MQDTSDHLYSWSPCIIFVVLIASKVCASKLAWSSPVILKLTACFDRNNREWHYCSGKELPKSCRLICWQSWCVQGLLVSPKMTEDHYTTSLLQSLKAVSERLAEQEGKSGKEQTQGSSQVAAADKKSNDPGQESQNNESGGLKEAVLGGVFDLV